MEIDPCESKTQLTLAVFSKFSPITVSSVFPSSGTDVGFNAVSMCVSV